MSLNQAASCCRLLHSRVEDATLEPHERTAFELEKDFSLFSVKYNDEDGSNDLIGCLANQVFPKLPKRGSLNVGPGVTGEYAITVTSDVIAFAPTRDESLPSYQDSVTGKALQRRKFSFPETFYLDRFLMANHERAQKVIQNANVAEEEIRRLIQKKSEFTKVDVSGVQSALAFGKLTGAAEEGRYEEHSGFAVLLRERGTFSDRRRTTSGHREFCDQTQEHHCTHRNRTRKQVARHLSSKCIC